MEDSVLTVPRVMIDGRSPPVAVPFIMIAKKISGEVIVENEKMFIVAELTTSKTSESMRIGQDDGERERRLPPPAWEPTN